MANITCKANNLSGKRCKRNPLKSGFCPTHDPEILNKKEEQKKADEKKRQKIDELLSIVTKTCKANGWGWEVDAFDDNDFSSAIVNVHKYVSGQDISALFHINISKDNIQYRIEKTSFYGYGVEALMSSISSAFERKGFVSPKSLGGEPNKKNSLLDVLPIIFERFHVVATQLSNRYNKRPTLTISDEYDVQDLLHALLRVHFTDVRPEEYTPSYAGSSSRIDFLLKDEKTLLEVKYATTSLKDKAIGEQLIIDVEKYKRHTDCENLFCFIYNPGFSIKNPSGLEKDLSGKNGNINVKVFVYPK
ncbi:MAG: hypothetical protein NTZ10_02135 [Candidatus Saganbacteria bacterium]|nr:hypothetical protein [Candidatus Saganbacteria bacterium]